MRRGICAAGLGLLVGIAAMGCAQERDPINRVQPDALQKSFFLGEDLQSTADDPVFWKRAYDVKNSFDAGFNFVIGMGSGMDRVRWEVTENMLIARKAYSVAPGRDDKGTANGPNNGTVVAAYKILSHFDVRRAYNSQTGEDINVVDENTSDRPWYQREYMRVDWSTNVVADPVDMFAMFGRWFGDPMITPLAYYVNDPKSEDAPFFDAKDGYFEVTNRYWVEPGKFEFDWGSIPACIVLGITLGTNLHDCNAQEAHVRLTFWRIPADHDYEPMENTKAPHDIINNFGGAGDGLQPGEGIGIQEYDPEYGYTDKGYHVPVTRHNIWKKSHVDNPGCESNADEDGDGTADQCTRAGSQCDLAKHMCTIACDSNVDVVNAEGGAGADGTADQCDWYSWGSKGSQCDLFTKQCTLPYRDRTLKTAGWWSNNYMPLDYQDPVGPDGNQIVDQYGNITRGAIEDMTYSWNQLFMASVAMTRAVECRRTGDGNRDQCYSTFFNPTKVMVTYGNWLVDDPIDKTDVHVNCHNPVRVYDNHEVCGETGFKARYGDLRKNFIADFPMATTAPFGAVTHWGTDPLTGELIGATTTSVHGRLRGQRLVDLMLYEMGDITLEQYLNGGAPEKFAQVMSNTKRIPITKEEINRRLSLIDTKSLAAAGGLTANSKQAVDTFLQKQKMNRDSRLVPNQAIANEQLATPLRAAGLERDLVDSKWLVGLNIDPQTAVDTSVLEQASPLRNLDAAKIQYMREFMLKRLAEGGYDYTTLQDSITFGPINNAPLVKYFTDKYKGLSNEERIKQIVQEIQTEQYEGMMIHEMGHAMGMRHQFSSSWDAMNYFPQYWQLRSHETATGKATPGGYDPATAAGSPMPTANCKAFPRDASQGVNDATKDACMGPRYLDPETDDELGIGEESRPHILYFGQTSTMEYQNESFSETSGVGTWDYHMTKAVYGGLLETIDDRLIPVADQYKYGAMQMSQLAEASWIYDVPERDDGGPYLFQLDSNGKSVMSVHYTKLARMLNVFDPDRDCRTATPGEKVNGKWRLVHNKVCQPYPRDNAAWMDFLTDEYTPLVSWGDPTTLAWHTRSDAPNKYTNGNVRWRFRTGESYDPAWIHTNMFDAGGDAYEITVDNIQHFDGNYPTSYFRRTNADRSAGGVPSAAANYTFDVLRSYHWSAANSLLNYLQYGNGAFHSLASDDDMARPDALANAEIFNALSRWVLLPQPGDFKLRAGDESGVYDAVNGEAKDADFHVNIIDGRYIDEAYNQGPSGGGSWDFDRYWTRAGFYTEKGYAFLALCDSRPTLSTIARENFLDGRGVKLNYRSDMPQAFDRLLGGVLSEDWASISPWVPGSATADVVAQPVQMNLTFADADYYQGSNYCVQNIDGNGNGMADQCEPYVGKVAGVQCNETLQVCTICTNNDDANGNGTADQCEKMSSNPWEVQGSQCNLTPGDVHFGMCKVGLHRPADAKVLYPNIGYLQQLYSAIFSALYARENTDMTLIHKMRIWVDGVEGNISDAAFPAPKDQLRYYDPNSGFTYIARRFGPEKIDGRDVERGIASRVLQRANRLLTLSYEVTKDTNGNPVLDEYGRPELTLDANKQPIPLPAGQSKQGQLLRYVGLVDSIRQLGQILGQGPY